jgi:hypothetical protein
LISERTRDKIAAARRKGKWSGGLPLLGYDVDPRGSKLVVNAEEAQHVQAIFYDVVLDALLDAGPIQLLRPPRTADRVGRDGALIRTLGSNGSLPTGVNFFLTGVGLILASLGQHCPLFGSIQFPGCNTVHPTHVGKIQGSD